MEELTHKIAGVYRGAERRRLPRVPLQANVRLRVFNNGGVDREGRTLNASADGAFVWLDSAVAPGCSLQLTIFLGSASAGNELQLRFEGTVTRIECHPDGVHYGLAIAFDENGSARPAG